MTADVADAERNSSSLHAEKSDSDGLQEKAVSERPLKLDAQGLPLAPQPSDRADDPLVRVLCSAISPSWWLRWCFPGNSRLTIVGVELAEMV
jgi:hypothetical protein